MLCVIGKIHSVATEGKLQRQQNCKKEEGSSETCSESQESQRIGKGFIISQEIN